MKILNLYAGIGGNRKLWGDSHNITAIEINSEIAAIYKKYFPHDNVIVTDAHQFLLENFDKFDFIWSSPPCQSHSKMARVNFIRYAKRQYFDVKLWQEIVLLKSYYKGFYVIENVNPYYDVLIPPNVKINRHLIWSNFNIKHIKIQKIANFIDSNYNDLKSWLGFNDFNYSLYLNGNNDRCQILRNCVHPEIGLHILNSAIKSYNYHKNTKQLSLWPILEKE